MKKLQFKTHINAPVKKVWDTMLEDKTYREWTVPFHDGSYFEGDWSKGSKIKFLGPDEQGGVGGMIARIAENKPYEFVSIEHQGMINNGVEDTTSEAVKKWTPAFENYTFKEVDGGTELVVDLDIHEDYAEMFTDMWPKALVKLKEIAERE